MASAYRSLRPRVRAEQCSQWYIIHCLTLSLKLLRSPQTEREREREQCCRYLALGIPGWCSGLSGTRSFVSPRIPKSSSISFKSVVEKRHFPSNALPAAHSGHQCEDGRHLGGMGANFSSFWKVGLEICFFLLTGKRKQKRGTMCTIPQCSSHPYATQPSRL